MVSFTVFFCYVCLLAVVFVVFGVGFVTFVLAFVSHSSSLSFFLLAGCVGSRGYWQSLTKRKSYSSSLSHRRCEALSGL